MSRVKEQEYIEPNGSIGCNQLDCCGVGEISGIGGATPEENLMGLFEYGIEQRYAYLIFTDVKRSKAGRELDAYIRHNNLGDVVEMPPKKNPNTQNTLTLWVWIPNYPAIQAWVRKVRESNKTL